MAIFSLANEGMRFVSDSIPEKEEKMAAREYDGREMVMEISGRVAQGLSYSFIIAQIMS